MRLTPGGRLGPYEILAPIGAGGMGAVSLHGAQALFAPKRKPIEFGVVRAGLLADLPSEVAADPERPAGLKESG